MRWDEMSMKFIYSSIRSIYKHCELVHVQRTNIVYICIAVAAVPWYNICIVLQIDQCRYFIIVLTIFVCYKRNARQVTHCWCDIHAPARCSLNTQAYYRDITSVLFCRLINEDILLLFLTIVIRYKAEIDILLMRYTHAPFQVYLSILLKG